MRPRAVSYNKHIEDSGPLFQQVVPEGDHIRIWFDHAAGGLTARTAELKGFEVAGSNGVFVTASATIAGNTVIVSSHDVPAPAWVR